MNLANTDFKQFRNDVVDALAAIAEKYGCEVTAGNIKYDTSSIDLALYFKAKGENGESAEEMDFKKYCGNYGFKPEDYNHCFLMDGKSFNLIGFNPRARKNYCIVRESQSGKTYVCPPTAIKNLP